MSSVTFSSSASGENCVLSAQIPSSSGIFKSFRDAPKQNTFLRLLACSLTL